MADTGLLIVGTGTAGGTGEAWGNPERITVEDGNNALVSVTAGESQELRGTNPDPALAFNAAVAGLEVQVEVVGPGGDDQISEVGLIYNGATIGTIKNPAQVVAETATQYIFGSPSDTWGATLTPQIVNSPSFGAYIKMAGSGFVGADAMWLRFTYEIVPFVSAPPRPAQPEFSLTFYTPVGAGLIRRRTDLVAIDPSVTALSFTTQLEGFGQLSVGLDNRHEPGQPLRYMYPAELPVDLPPFAEVQLTDGGSGSVLWEGRAEDFSRVRGVISGFTATGYGLTATRDGYISDDDDTETTTGTILLASLLAIPTLRAASDFVDPQIATSYRTLGAMTVADLVSQVVSTGDAHGQQLDFSVWEGRIAELRGRSRPMLPHYRIDEDETVQVDVSYANVYGAVNVQFQTQTNGEASLVAGSDSVTVMHDLQVVPREDQITVNSVGGAPRIGGSATVVDNTTSVTVNHGLSATPDIKQIDVTVTNDLGNAAKWWIENVTASSFDIAIDGDPGLTGATFEWSIPTTYAIANLTSTTFDITLDASSNALAATFEWSVNVDNALTDEASVTIADLPRRAILIPGGTLNYELAIGYRDAMLVMLSQPEYRVTINRHVSNWLSGPRGEPVPPWLVRAGQWIQVGDLPMQIILRTTYDPFSETFSLEAGAPQRDLGTLLSSMQRTVERLAAARNANTGAKLS